MLEIPEDKLLKAFTGLVGGLVSSGSNCGVISGGAMGLALSQYDLVKKRGVRAQEEILSQIRQYIKWFENKYGSFYCRERVGVDFNTLTGLLRYLLPGDKVMKCLWHIRGATRHLCDYEENELPTMESGNNEKHEAPIHCAQVVLKDIKEQTGIGDDILEELSFVFDGGTGLHGGACGALVGAILSLNLLYGMDVRDMSFLEMIKAFFAGQNNLRGQNPPAEPESYYLGKGIVDKFKESAGAIECKSITGKIFLDWSDFQNYVSTSDKCSELFELCKELAVQAIKANALRIAC